MYIHVHTRMCTYIHALKVHVYSMIFILRKDYYHLQRGCQVCLPVLPSFWFSRLAPLQTQTSAWSSTAVLWIPNYHSTKPRPNSTKHHPNPQVDFFKLTVPYHVVSYSYNRLKGFLMSSTQLLVGSRTIFCLRKPIYTQVTLITDALLIFRKFAHNVINLLLVWHFVDIMWEYFTQGVLFISENLSVFLQIRLLSLILYHLPAVLFSHIPSA